MGTDRGVAALASLSRHDCGATPAQIADAAESTGTAWPPELIEFYEQINGFALEEFVRLLPGRELSDLERVVQEREMELDVYAETNEIEEYEPPEGSTAGTAVFTYMPEFIPFAGLDGYLLFVDTRPGGLYARRLDCRRRVIVAGSVAGHPR